MLRKNFYNWLIAVFVLVLLTTIASADINDQVAQLDFNTSTHDDVINIFGEPLRYIVWGEGEFDPNDPPEGYCMIYSDDLHVCMTLDGTWEVRFESPALGYVWQGGITVGSSLQSVLEVLPPDRTVVGQPNGWEDGVLYKDINGAEGNCYYCRPDQNIRLFFWDYKVSSLYLTGNVGQPNGPISLITFPKIDRKPAPLSVFDDRGALSSIPSYDPSDDNSFQVDLRSYDLSALDLRSSLDDLLFCVFNSQTIWPSVQQMPPEFDYLQVMELGKNPGLRVRDLHTQGITGANVGIAIIDQPLLTEHQEYADRLRLYEEINVDPNTSARMHGAAVASIAVGQTVGVAPEADLYYIGSWTGDRGVGGFTWNFSYYAQGIRRILEINEQLPEGRKIRVIAMQVGWSNTQAGYIEIMAACDAAKAAGMLIVSSCIDDIHDGFKFHGLGRSPLSNPDIFESYQPGTWWAQSFYEGWRFSDRLLVPMDSRTTASPCGDDDFVWYSTGGWSWSIPYIAGLYALAAQVAPEITPEEFWSLAMETGRVVELVHDNVSIAFGPIVDPAALINSLSLQPIDQPDNN